MVLTCPVSYREQSLRSNLPPILIAFLLKKSVSAMFIFSILIWGEEGMEKDGEQAKEKGWLSISLSHHIMHWAMPSSVQFSRSVMSNSLWPHEPQHTRPPCPSPTPRVHPNPCPLCWWCHPTISSSVIPFSSCPESLPASGSFPMSQLFPWGGRSIGVSALASVPPVNTQDWSPLGWTG